MPRGPGTVQGQRAATTGSTTIGDACASWIIFYVTHLKSIFCAGEDTDPKIWDEGRIPQEEPYATLVAIFGDSKRARRHYCPGGGTDVGEGGRHGGDLGVVDWRQSGRRPCVFFGGSSEFGFRPDVGSRFLA